MERDVSESLLVRLWKEHVDAAYLYRGMSLKDLGDCLDPTADPFADVRPKLRRLIDLLQRLLDAGFEFTVHEDYSGLSFDLADILAWSRHDLDDPGIDFTSSHENARGYARNFQGSQLKQNLRYITGHLPERGEDRLVRTLMRPEDWRLAADVNRWASRASASHRMAVIWVRRSCRVFDSARCDAVSVGSYPRFREKVMERMARDHLPPSEEAVRGALREPDAFDVRITQPLPRAEIERVEEIG